MIIKSEVVFESIKKFVIANVFIYILTAFFFILCIYPYFMDGSEIISSNLLIIFGTLFIKHFATIWSLIYTRFIKYLKFDKKLIIPFLLFDLILFFICFSFLNVIMVTFSIFGLLYSISVSIFVLFVMLKLKELVKTTIHKILLVSIYKIIGLFFYFCFFYFILRNIIQDFATNNFMQTLLLVLFSFIGVSLEFLISILIYIFYGFIKDITNSIKIKLFIYFVTEYIILFVIFYILLQNPTFFVKYNF